MRKSTIAHDKEILNIIQQRRKITIDELSRKTGLANVTVKSSVERLKSQHREIDILRGYNGGVYWEPILMDGVKEGNIPNAVENVQNLRSDFDALQHEYDDLKEKYDLLVQNSRSLEKRVREEYEGFVEPLVYANVKKTADEYKEKYEGTVEVLKEATKELNELHENKSNDASVDFEARYVDLRNINVELEASNKELRNLLIELIKLAIDKANG